VSTEKLLIAVVDDEENVRRALQRLFRSAGMDVETFPSGAEFLEALKTREPDCVVLDLHMPGVNGFEVQARFTEAAISVPVIVITGHDTEESRCRALGAGAFAYLRKPVDDEILLEAIQAAVAKHKN
jgi:FixJ family two-component response regulator